MTAASLGCLAPIQRCIFPPVIFHIQWYLSSLVLVLDTPITHTHTPFFCLKPLVEPVTCKLIVNQHSERFPPMPESRWQGGLNMQLWHVCRVCIRVKWIHVKFKSKERARLWLYRLLASQLNKRLCSWEDPPVLTRKVSCLSKMSLILFFSHFCLLSVFEAKHQFT